jgi:hypothetical protein
MARESGPTISNTVSGGFLPPTISNVSSSSSELVSGVVKSVVKSAKIKAATHYIQDKRSKLSQILAENELGLWTSAVEFRTTGDFIGSSYIEYRTHNGAKEPLRDFLNRYPRLTELAQAVQEAVTSQQENLDVVSPTLTNPNPFGIN